MTAHRLAPATTNLHPRRLRLRTTTGFPFDLSEPVHEHHNTDWNQRLEPQHPLDRFRSLDCLLHPGYGLNPFASAAAESIARQPEAADKITGAVNLPLFLLEGVAILAEVFAFLMLVL